MALITFVCPKCKRWIKSPAELAGTTVCCPNSVKDCYNRSVVPQTSQSPPSFDQPPLVSTISVQWTGAHFRVDDTARLTLQGHSESSWASYDRSGQRIRSRDNTPEEALSEWDAIMLDVASRWQGRDELMSAIADNKLFIRFGNLPRNKRSRNHLTGKLEPGLSCYRAKANFYAESFELTGGGLSMAVFKAALGGYGHVNLLLRGEVAGVGADGEPCVKRVKVLGNLKWDIQKSSFILVDQLPSKADNAN